MASDKDFVNDYEFSQTSVDGRPAIKIKRNKTEITLPSSKFDELQSQAESMKKLGGMLVRDFGDYLFADDRGDIHYVLRSSNEVLASDFVFKRARNSPDGLRDVLRRANNLIEANVPPIFSPDSESTNQRVDDRGFLYHKYPTADAIINIFGRNYVHPEFQRIAARASLERINFFRIYATRPSFVSNVKKEIVQRVEDIFGNRFESEDTEKYVISHVQSVFDSLAEKLGSVDSDRNLLLQSFNSAQKPADVVSQPFWYTQFDSESVGQILSKYWSNFRSEFVKSDTNNIFNFMTDYSGVQMARTVFEEQTPNLREMEVQRIIDNRDYSYINEGLVNNISPDLREALRKSVRGYLGSRKLPNVSLSLEDMSKSLHISPNAYVNQEILSPVLEQSLIERASKCPDKELIEYFNTTQGFRLKKYPALQKTIGQRLHRLIGEVGTKRDGSFYHKARNIGIGQHAINAARKTYQAYLAA